MSRLPQEMSEELTKVRREIDELAVETFAARRFLAEAQARYEEDSQRALFILAHDCKTKGERLPGEDVRLAMVHDAIGYEMYGEYLKLKAKVDALDRVGRLKSAVCSALQSELAFAREEFKGVG